ncbi:hypothetical protein DOTSEDRAFT_120969 [Dothistroma septosporum NZE10]|uniref:Uncharacterized protein n=1 Tax=Dothistroma septosporum (strain NZE10 / CBS 128990) TaxID=675120 RepID=N1Q1G9_DOTSN|nr:hypothetical protein DOTSEDRAFT_120969 [Dothistroma septosporum NZE10]
MVLLRRCLRVTRQPFITRYALPTRTFTTTSLRCNDKENLMNKDSINTDSREYSKTGGDSSAATEDAAFDPQQTSPEEQHESAKRESGGSNNPLNVSPANKEISDPNDANKGGATGSPSETGSGSGSGRERSSGGGSPKKSGGGKSGGGPL